MTTRRNRQFVSSSASAAARRRFALSRLSGSPGRIASGLDRRVALLALNPDERGALLDVLEEAERPALAELCGVLVDDLAHRRGIGSPRHRSQGRGKRGY